MSFTPGQTQKAILRASIGGHSYLAVRRSTQLSCMRLHDKGFLDRDPAHTSRFRASVIGEAWIKEFDANFGRGR